MRRGLRQKTHELGALHESERLRLALAASGAAVYEWTIADGRMAWSGNAKDVLPIASVEGLDQRARYESLVHEAEAHLFEGVLARNPGTDEIFSLEYRMRAADGSFAWVEDRGIALSNGKEVERVIGTVRVVTERKARESRLVHLASYDDLTGHMNRSRLRERLAEALAQARNEETPCAYFVVAVDGLATLNEAYGYDVADEVIVAASQRLSGALRGGDAMGRIAGNKFGVLLSHCRETDIPFAAERLRAAVRSSVVRTTGGAVAATVSMGAVAIPSAASTSQEAMLRAEEALDKAKSAGRDSFSIYQPSMQMMQARRKNVAMGEQVLSALNERRLVFAYQPIVAARSGKAASYECLLRMLTPDGQVAPAGDFIPVAEQLGLVRLVDRRVLEMAADALARQDAVDLSINVSGLSVGDPAWLATFDDLLRHQPGFAKRLTVELTETTALHDIADSARFVARLREAGAKVAIDDFGAGYTSFRNLQHLHVDTVKIDGSFVRGLATNRDNQLFVRTLIHLANNFELETVAEWVGEADEVELLKGYGVDYFQGAYFGLPDISQPWSER